MLVYSIHVQIKTRGLRCVIPARVHKFAGEVKLGQKEFPLRMSTSPECYFVIQRNGNVYRLVERS